MNDDETLAVPVALARKLKERRARQRVKVPALTIVFHPEMRRVGQRVMLSSLASGSSVRLSRHEPEFAAPGSDVARALEEPYVSRRPIELRTGGEQGAVRIVVEEPRPEITVGGTPLEETRELSPEEIADGVVLELGGRVVLLLHPLTKTLIHLPDRLGLVGDSEAITQVRQEIDRVADLEVPVLIRGETGTGKELVARAVHDASRRHDLTFLSVNMGALSPALAAAELFGSVKGAFTGAVRDRLGYFHRADNGTLFLDEIGEAPAEVQVMLLRVLESSEIQQVGGQRSQKVDVRLIAATDVDLEAAIKEGSFKEPLLHRLSGYEIVVAPLRERRDDFGRLFLHFVRLELRDIGEEHRLDRSGPGDDPWIPASIVARLARHSWPGNVRQLRNVARQLVIGSRGQETVRVGPQVERLLREVAAGEDESEPAAPEVAAPATPKRKPVATYRKPSEVGEEELVAALRANRWRLKPTAVQLGVSRPSLYTLIEKFPNVRKASDLSREEILRCREECGGDLGAMVEKLEVSRSALKLRMKQLDIGP